MTTADRVAVLEAERLTGMPRFTVPAAVRAEAAAVLSRRSVLLTAYALPVAPYRHRPEGRE